MILIPCFGVSETREPDTLPGVTVALAAQRLAKPTGPRGYASNGSLSMMADAARKLFRNGKATRRQIVIAQT